MAFTWSSRSRTSGDPSYHRWAALASNGVWFICQIFILKNIWSSITSGDLLQVAIAGLSYTLATSGSVFMMRCLIKREKGTRRVGAYKDK